MREALAHFERLKPCQHYAQDLCVSVAVCAWKDYGARDTDLLRPAHHTATLYFGPTGTVVCRHIVGLESWRLCACLRD